MFSSMVPLNRNGSCSTMPMVLPRLSSVTSRTSCPPIRMRAFVDLVEAPHQRDDAGLARTRRAHQGHDLFGFHLERDVLQHRPLRVVAEGDVVELDGRVVLVEDHRVRLVDERQRHVEHLEHAVGRRPWRAAAPCTASTASAPARRTAARSPRRRSWCRSRAWTPITSEPPTTMMIAMAMPVRIADGRAHQRGEHGRVDLRASCCHAPFPRRARSSSPRGASPAPCARR